MLIDAQGDGAGCTEPPVQGGPDQSRPLALNPARALSSGDFAAFDFLCGPIWVVDLTNLQPLYANDAALQAVGCASLAEWVVSPLPCLAPLLAEACHRTPEALAAHLAQGTPETLEVGPDQGLLCRTQAVMVDRHAPALLIEATPIRGLAAKSLPAPYDQRPAPQTADLSASLSYTALAHTALMVTLYDLDGTMLYQNPAATAAYGTDPDVLGAFISRITDAQEALTAWAWVRRGQPYRCESPVRTLGGVRWHAIEARRAQSDADQAPVVVVTEQDISDQIQNQQSLRQSVERLARVNAELEQFAWITSHDLREPLRTVVSYVTLLERHLGDKLDGTGREFMDFAVKGAKRMDALTRDLLHYASIGRTSAPRQPINLQALMAALVTERRAVLEACGGHITYECLPTIEGDLQELSILFANLLDNAIAYRKPDLPLQVQVICEQEAQSWLIAVIDNGQGINPRYFDRIFQIFQRLQTPSDHQGTGVGLALCRKVVERHGGRIWLESNEGRGAAFFISFPFAR
jgi:signal transduction histidine kinase